MRLGTLLLPASLVLAIGLGSPLLPSPSSLVLELVRARWVVWKCPLPLPLPLCMRIFACFPVFYHITVLPLVCRATSERFGFWRTVQQSPEFLGLCLRSLAGQNNVGGQVRLSLPARIRLIIEFGPRALSQGLCSEEDLRRLEDYIYWRYFADSLVDYLNSPAGRGLSTERRAKVLIRLCRCVLADDGPLEELQASSLLRLLQTERARNESGEIACFWEQLQSRAAAGHLGIVSRALLSTGYGHDPDMKGWKGLLTSPSFCQLPGRQRSVRLFEAIQPSTSRKLGLIFQELLFNPDILQQLAIAERIELTEGLWSFLPQPVDITLQGVGMHNEVFFRHIGSVFSHYLQRYRQYGRRRVVQLVGLLRPDHVSALIWHLCLGPSCRYTARVDPRAWSGDLRELVFSCYVAQLRDRPGHGNPDFEPLIEAYRRHGNITPEVFVSQVLPRSFHGIAYVASPSFRIACLPIVHRLCRECDPEEAGHWAAVSGMLLRGIIQRSQLRAFIGDLPAVDEDTLVELWGMVRKASKMSERRIFSLAVKYCSQ